MRPMRTERVNCYICGEPVAIPPGTYYRGLKVHKQCARLRRQSDISSELVSPAKQQDEDIIRSYLYNMGSHPS